MTSEYKNYDEYEREILQEIRDEANENDPVRKRVQLISFTSYSGGRGKKRKPREVSLLVVDNKYAYVVEGSEISGRKNNDHIKLDILAHEVLSFLPPDERTIDKLLELASVKSR